MLFFSGALPANGSDNREKLCYNTTKGGDAMFRNLLRPDSGLMITMTQLTDMIFLSLFWILGCLPVVTIGASCAALYDAAFRGFRQGEKHSWQRFWRVFRDNWKAGLVPTVLFLLLLSLLVKGLILVWNAAVAGRTSWMLFSASRKLM